MRSDKIWESVGARDPYFGVYSHARFHGGANKQEFFRSGDEHLEALLPVIKEFSPAFAPKRAVDFGCGVGRVVIPLSPVCGSVVGVDISTGMLDEARRNCRELNNVEFARSPEDLQGHFDFIHSYIVFQHIRATHGLVLMESLVSRLEEGGIGALHFIYGSSLPWWKQLYYQLNHLPGVTGLANLAQGRPVSFHPVQMKRYPLKSVMEILRRHHCCRVGGYLTDHDGHLGMMLLFERSPEGRTKNGTKIVGQKIRQ